MSGLLGAQFADQMDGRSKSLSNSLPVMTSFALPVPSNLNWLMPYFVDHVDAGIAEVA